MSNWYIKWKNTNRTTPECANLIAKHGWKYYGIYAAAREIISQHGGAAPVDVVANQLGIPREDLEPIFVIFCYDLLSGLLSEKSLKNDAERQKLISEKRSAAGKKAMEKRWNKEKNNVATGSKSTKSKKSPTNITQPVLIETDDVKNGHDSGDNKCYDIYNSNSNIDNVITKVITDEKKQIITNVINQAGELYVDFYKKMTGLEPQRSAAGNKAMRSMAVYFYEQIAKSGKHAPENFEAQTLECFKYIFKNVKFWGKFESDRVRLQDINSNLANIIKNIKSSSNGKHSTNGQSSNGNIQSRVATSLSNIDEVQL